MIRRWFILGLIITLMVGLLWNFYSQVLAYDPMGALRQTELAESAEIPEAGPYVAAWSKDIKNKDLFSARRGYVPPPPPRQKSPQPSSAAPPPPPKPVRPDLKLSGIILNQYGEYIAFVTIGDATRRLMLGDSFEGVEVVDIKQREVTLLWEGEEINLSLKRIKKLR